MSAYHAAGAISTLLFALALAGVALQLSEIWQRRVRVPGESPTAILSLNQFAVSFLGYFAFFVYGFCVQPFNHYLVWPRLVGSLLVLAVVFEIARDRRTGTARAAFASGALLIGLGLAVLAQRPDVTAAGRTIPQTMSVVATALLIQGFAHQILLIRRSGRTGAVSWRMHALVYLKDLSLVGFGLTMPIASGWPLVMMGGAAVAVKSLLLWQFRWVERSPIAAARRASQAPA